MAKGADIYSGFKRNDDEFPYEPVGVYRLLKEYHRLEGRISPGGDYDTAVILADLKDALDSEVLTARQRQVVALLFFLNVTMEEAAEILGVAVSKVHKYLVGALKRLSYVLKSERSPNVEWNIKSFESRRPLFMWLNAVGTREAPVYVVPAEVMRDLLTWLDENGDSKAQEVLRQRREGPPDVREVYENPEDENPCLNPRQMQYRDKKEKKVPEVMPRFDVGGSKKAAVKDAKSGTWSQLKQKIYIFSL